MNRALVTGIYEIFANVKSSLAPVAIEDDSCGSCNEYFQHSQHILIHISDTAANCHMSFCASCFGDWIKLNNHKCTFCERMITIPSELNINEAIELAGTFHIYQRLEHLKNASRHSNTNLIINSFWRDAPGLADLNSPNNTDVYKAIVNLESSQYLATLATFTDKAHGLASEAELTFTPEDITINQNRIFTTMQAAFYNHKYTIQEALEELKQQMIVPQAIAASYTKTKLHAIFREAYKFTAMAAMDNEMKPEAVSRFIDAFVHCEKQFLSRH